MSAPLAPPLDGDFHFVGRARQVELPLVAEIANAREENAAVDLVHRVEARHGTLRISGVWRIWPEHAGRAKEEQGEPLPAFQTDNPNHVFEIHPVTRIDRLSLLDSVHPVKGFEPGDAARTFGIFQKATCTLKVTPKTVAIVAETGLYNDVEFVMKLAPEPQRVGRDGRFVIASAMDRNGRLLVERLRMVFARGTPPEEAVKRLKVGDQLHVFGVPRIDFSEIARRVKSYRPGVVTPPQHAALRDHHSRRLSEVIGEWRCEAVRRYWLWHWHRSSRPVRLCRFCEMPWGHPPSPACAESS